MYITLNPLLTFLWRPLVLDLDETFVTDIDVLALSVADQNSEARLRELLLQGTSSPLGAELNTTYFKRQRRKARGRVGATGVDGIAAHALTLAHRLPTVL